MTPNPAKYAWTINNNGSEMTLMPGINPAINRMTLNTISFVRLRRFMRTLLAADVAKEKPAFLASWDICFSIFSEIKLNNGDMRISMIYFIKIQKSKIMAIPVKKVKTVDS